ncbi:hypothetical protein ACFFVE_16505, partial [Vibrio sinaloensis]
ISVDERTYDKNYFGFYISHTASSAAVKEAQAKDIKSVKDHWSAKFGKIFIIGGLVYLVGVYFFMFRGDSEEEAQPTPQPTEQIEQVAQPKPAINQSQGFGFLDGFQFYVSGWSKQLVETDGRFDSERSFYRVYVDVYREDKFEFTLEHTDLIKLGYAFKQLSECVYQLKYFDSSRVVTCRKSVIEPQPNDNVLDVIKTVPSVEI